MTTASANTRVVAGVCCALLVGIVAASIALAAGIRPVASARRAEISSDYALIPAQLSMGRPGTASVPAPRRLTAPVNPDAGLTPAEQKRLTETLNRMTPKERKRLTKAVKRMTPEQRRQFIAALKRQLAKNRTAATAGKRAR